MSSAANVTSHCGMSAETYHGNPSLFRLVDAVIADKPCNKQCKKKTGNVLEVDKFEPHEYSKYASWWWKCTNEPAWVCVRCGWDQIELWMSALSNVGFVVSYAPMLCLKDPRFCNYRKDNLGRLVESGKYVFRFLTCFSFSLVPCLWFPLFCACL